MRKYVTILFVFGCQLVWSQTAPVLGGVQAAGIDMNMMPGGFITEIKDAAPGVKGSVYLFDEWRSMDVTIDQKVFKDMQVNYNLQHDRYEYIQGKNLMKISAKVSNIKDLAGTYFQSRLFKLPEGTPVAGICHQLGEKKEWTLVAHYSLTVIEPNYNQAMAVGEKDRTLAKKKTYGFISGETFYPVIPNKKKFARQFGAASTNLLQFLKDSKIDLKDESSLAQVSDYLNANSK